ncbi:hypothetical protein [Dyadobacter sp. NIV53]|uniref:hypothetical protein n=1 Tax=Dyadobacter sp. NIV53 TaxID=2861765 RepID=UPI001C88768F|nr:hypothetical protein [Dyadobacter sp. NIV53]
MKTKNLLSNAWRPFGWVLIIIVILMHLWGVFMGEQYPLNFGIEIPLPFNFGGFDLSENHFIIQGKLHLQALEIISLLMIAGLMIVGFSRLKIEDERVAQIRLESLQWGIYANYLILALCILLVYGGAFFMIMTYAMFTPLLIFLLRFYWLLLIAPAIEANRERNLA